MAHLRINADTIQQRSERQERPAKRPPREREYLFTQSRWHAIAHISADQTTLEDGYVDPSTVFPGMVMKNIDKAVKHGITAYVTQYRSVAGQPVGAVLHLYIENYRGQGSKDIGYYAVKYGKSANLGETLSSTPAQ